MEKNIVQNGTTEPTKADDNLSGTQLKMKTKEEPSPTTTILNTPGGSEDVSSTSGNVKGDKLSSDAEADATTKRIIRLKMWRRFESERLSTYPSTIFNRIPNFTGAEKAAKLLADTPEFENAKHIKVNLDRSQDPVKLQVLEHKKILYVSPERESDAALARINCENDEDENERKKAIRLQNLKTYGVEIAYNEDTKIDMLVIGCVAVSRDGYRIGKGNGYVDLDFGILTKCKAITNDTIIVTTVHDIQVFDTLPVELFTKYDLPVDMIVTPTEVIRIAKRLPRPAGVFWDCLSERRLGVVPVLKLLKAEDEKNGKIIVLKDEDTDVEAYRRRGPPRRQFRRRFGRRYGRPSGNNRNNNNNNNNNNDGENEERENKGANRPRRRFFNRRPRPRAGGNDGTATDDNQNTSSANRVNNRNRYAKRRQSNNRDFCIKVSNIARGMRVKDLKTEIRSRGCNPTYISWGPNGRCYLHFGRPNNVEDDEIITKTLSLLENLSVKYTDKEELVKEAELKVEILKRSVNQEDSRVESVDVSSV